MKNKTIAFLMVIGLSGLAFKRSLNKANTTYVSNFYIDSPSVDSIKLASKPLDSGKIDSTQARPTTSTKNIFYGSASFYADKFEGRKTSSGEVFSQKALTAAHRKLPLGTTVRVTNLNNKRSVVVRINDRMGRSNHQIDLSKAAAKQIGILGAGHARVSIEVLD